MKIDRLMGILTLLNAAIRDRRIVAFHYYCSKGEEDKRVEPYRLVSVRVLLSAAGFPAV